MSTIQYWVERDPDCPVRTWDKLPDWRTYSATKVADQDGYGKTLTNLRKEVEVRIKEADLDKKQMELAEARGDLNSQEECSVVLTESFGRLWTEFQRLANTIVNDINREHGSVTKQRQIAQEKIYEIFEQFTLGDWVKKKAFFKILSATFADHQASLLPGSGVKNTSG